jgi:hypothetical protein
MLSAAGERLWLEERGGEDRYEWVIRLIVTFCCGMSPGRGAVCPARLATVSVRRLGY